MFRYNRILSTLNRKTKKFLTNLSSISIADSLYCFSKSKKVIFGFWSENRDTKKNFGDALNPILIHYLSGKKVFNHRNILFRRNEPVYIVIGSVLDGYNIKNGILWGAGFKREKGRIKRKPEKICAVRGPLTRQKFIDMGVDCPEIYGDPALLYSMVYRPRRENIYKLGLIPHYIDYHNPIIDEIIKRDSGIKLIDIKGGVNNVVDQVNKCETVVSSSLHGIIIADSYKIPSVWVKFSDNIAGGTFKFEDYYLSIGRGGVKPVNINRVEDWENISENIWVGQVSLDLGLLIASCPFLKTELSWMEKVTYLNISK